MLFQTQLECIGGKIPNIGRYFGRPDDGFNDKPATRNVVIYTVCSYTLRICNISLFRWVSPTFFSAKAVPPSAWAYIPVSAFENNILDASLDLQNRQKTTCDGYTGQEML